MKKILRLPIPCLLFGILTYASGEDQTREILEALKISNCAEVESTILSEKASVSGEQWEQMKAVLLGGLKNSNWQLRKANGSRIPLWVVHAGNFDADGEFVHRASVPVLRMFTEPSDQTKFESLIPKTLREKFELWRREAIK